MSSSSLPATSFKGLVGEALMVFTMGMGRGQREIGASIDG
jgi:hypothetical protein